MQLQPFFDWLLRTTLQASLLICLILLFQVVLRSRLGARWHYCLWLLLLIRMAMPWAPQSRVSVFNLIPQSLPQRQTEYIQQDVGDDAVSSDAASPSTAESTPVSTTEVVQDTSKAITVAPEIRKESKGRLKPVVFEIADILPLIWLTGALILAVYVCANNFNLLRIVKRERPLTNQKILDLLEDCKAEMGIRIILGVVATDKVKSPALFGFIRPRLLLPKGMLDTLSREELRYVFLHELAHLKRHDIYIGWLMSLLQVLHWFNPLIWLAFYRLRADRELACDALVLARTQSSQAKDYGRTIVSLLERFSRSQRLPAMAGILETKAQLKRRIKMIARFKKNSYQWSPLTVILIIILACVSLPDATGSKTLGISWAKSEPSVSLRRVKTGPMSDFSSPPSLDGRYLCDVQSRPMRLVIRDLVTGEVRPLTEPTEGYFWCPVISPESKHVAYVHQSWSPPESELQLIRMDGTGRRVLYRLKEDEKFHIRAWTPDGKKILGAFKKGSESLQLVAFSIEDGSMQVIYTFDIYWPVWRSPLHKLAISPDGRYIAYDRPPEKGSWNAEIYILDIEHQRAACVVQHPAYDKLLGWTPDGNFIFFSSDRRQGLPGGFTVTDSWDAYLLPVSESRRQGAPVLIKRDIPDKIRPKGFTRDGAYYYAIEFRTIEAVVAKLDLQTGKLLTKPHAVGQTGADQLPAWSPDGRHLAYCVHQLNNYQTIRIQNLETSQERELDPNLPHFSWLRWSPDGKSLLVSNFDKKLPQAIYRINASTGECVAVVQTESSDTLLGRPQLSLDGSTLFYVLRHPDSKKASLLIRDLESSGEKELFSLDGTLTFVLSPDGQQLALATQKEKSSGAAAVNRILTMPAKGGQTKELLKTEERTRTVAWTPDGQSLLFNKRIPEGGRELWLVPADGGQAHKLCSLQEMRLPEMTYGTMYSALDVHPDGQRIAFDCFEYRHEVWVMENFLPTGVSQAK